MRCYFPQLSGNVHEVHKVHQVAWICVAGLGAASSYSQWAHSTQPNAIEQNRSLNGEQSMGVAGRGELEIVHFTPRKAQLPSVCAKRVGLLEQLRFPRAH